MEGSIFFFRDLAGGPTYHPPVRDSRAGAPLVSTHGNLTHRIAWEGSEVILHRPLHDNFAVFTSQWPLASSIQRATDLSFTHPSHIPEIVITYALISRPSEHLRPHHNVASQWLAHQKTKPGHFIYSRSRPSCFPTSYPNTCYCLQRAATGRRPFYPRIRIVASQRAPSMQLAMDGLSRPLTITSYIFSSCPDHSPHNSYIPSRDRLHWRPNIVSQQLLPTHPLSCPSDCSQARRAPSSSQHRASGLNTR